ncbi:hypothetical protein DBR40_07465 [Pedobacter sp. KBW01]|uniref:Crp/Fnr family transcriptional regulator n=1 Tax=Pedobacter sp. KBW01 TaxID=2153364 RepID=UPI000F59F3E8|nr:Crp/Fnr family transcriptional regulator [Pedobacter sp. KBW01]RQO77805.1 hypothetical protein DBR40_07465 [Pedobacter sp. KBW01]
MLSDLQFDHLLGRMLGFHAVSPGFIQAMRPLLDIIQLPKGRCLLTSGQRPSKVWYIIKGFAKEVSYDSGLGRASWFWSEGDFVYAYPGFFSQAIAVNDIEVIVDSILIEISYEKFIELKNGFSEIPLLVEKIRDYYDSLRQAHAADLLTLKAGERFRKFVTENKSLFQMAKRGDIASFLGIKDNSLRRYG